MVEINELLTRIRIFGQLPLGKRNIGVKAVISDGTRVAGSLVATP
jgi:hypothetical protein